MPQRQDNNSICKVTNLVHHSKPRGVATILLSVDIRKACDSVSWPYLTYDLDRCGFGPHICLWVAIFYNKPPAKVKYMGHISSAFPISRGTRQVCPLSPLLFNLAIEPLATLIRQSLDVGGLEIVGNQYKINLFVEDAPESTAHVAKCDDFSRGL